MIDLHCHVLPGVDDGAPDLDAAIAMAQRLAAAGFTQIASSPHFGGGPGGDVWPERAAQARALLIEALAAHGVALRVVANAEHYVSPELMGRLTDASVLTPVGGAGRWLLVELPWEQIPQPEHVLFRLQAKGYKLLLAHPERYSYLDLDTCARLCERGVRLQLELGSFMDVYGGRARARAEQLMTRGLSHVLASDLHRPQQADEWLTASIAAVRKRFGESAVQRGLTENPGLILGDAPTDELSELHRP